MQELMINPENYPQYRIIDETIKRKIPWKRNVFNDDYKILPKPQTWNEIIRLAHEKTIHAGMRGTFYELNRFYWWPFMKRDIRDYINTCKKCAAVKNPNYLMTPPMGNFKVPNDVMISLSIDIKGPLPSSGPQRYKYIITLIDLLSRYAWGKKVHNVTSSIIIKFLKSVFEEQGKIAKNLYHDNGSVFTSIEFQNFLKMISVRSLPTPIYHPQSNTVERFNRSLTEALRFELSDNPMKQNSWSNKLEKIIKGLNDRVNEVTGYTPHEVHYGNREGTPNNDPINPQKHAEIKKTAYKRSILRYLQNTRQFNKRSLFREFLMNEIVMFRTFQLSSADKNIAGKLFPPWDVGKIVQKVHSNTFEILKIDGKKIKVNTKMLKRISDDLQDKMRYLFD
jgi:transposase InsO family protein